MENPNAFISWYTVPANKTLARTAPANTEALDPAREVFDDAVQAFESELSKDKTKSTWIRGPNHGSLDKVLQSIFDARVQYELRKGDSRTRQTLVQLSEKIHHYGTIMDVMVQHHPEYVSLAWGAMKVLFVGVVNQQNLLSQLSMGLCQIADILPRTELILRLYPTEQVKHAIVAMYAHILRFLMRALRWYQESKAKHALHAITRPAELRYDDLLKKISSLSDSLTEFASVSSQAEQRDMHSKIKQNLSEQKAMQISIEQLASLVLQMKETMATEQVINASARIEVRQTLSEIQLVQFMSLLSVTVLLDPTKTFQASQFWQNRRRLKSSNNGSLFWRDPKMQTWSCSKGSSLVMVSATRKLRFHVKDFCTNSIAMLQKDHVPVIWALKAMDTRETVESPLPNQVSTIDLLKYLISQAIRVNEAIHTDAALTPRLKLYMDAKTEQEWLDILAMTLQGLPLIYIVIDIELLNPLLVDLTENFSWPAAFLKIFSELGRRNIKTVVKVILVSYGSPVLKKNMSEECQKLMVTVNQHQKSPRTPYENREVLTREKRRTLALNAGRNRGRARD